MKLTVDVRARGEIQSFGASMEVPEPLIEAFKPMRTTDNCFGFIVGDIGVNSLEAKRGITLREDAAKYISEAITEMLIREMRKYDQFNGYDLE